nr:odorant binding protein 16 [Megachile saussurei]
MKTVAVLLILYIASSSAWLTSDQQAELKKLSEECSKEVDISIEKVQRALLGGEDEDKDKLQCYAECLLRKADIMDKDGNINEAILRKKMPKDVPKEEVENIIKECAKVDGDTRCEKAVEFANCVVKSIAIQELS